MIQFVKTICTVAALGLGMAAFSPALAQAPAEKPAAKKNAAKPADTKPAGPAVFPSKISEKYAKEKPARARLKTCSDQYQANKASNANGGLKWIVKGGGYWSECSKKLKAA
jgi:hypothetical protein